MMLEALVEVQPTNSDGAISAARTVGGRAYAFEADAETAAILSLTLEVGGVATLDAPEAAYTARTTPTETANVPTVLRGQRHD